MKKLYLVKVSDVWFAYPATIGDRELPRETAAQNWKSAYPEHADTIEVVDAPAVDADGNQFKCAWGWSYKRNGESFRVHANGR